MRGFVKLVGVGMFSWMLGTAPPACAADARELATTVCAACHGADGISVAPVFPKLAGLQETYLAKQLHDFLSGKRKSEVMAPFLDKFKDEDVPSLAAYYAGQQPASGAAEDQKLAEAGKKLFEDGNADTGVPGCMGCHMRKGEGHQRYPRLAGQHKAYTMQQMTDFKSGVRNNDRAKVMRAIAGRMSEAEMQAVAEYLGGL